MSAQEFAAFLSVEDHPDPEDDRVCDMINERMRKMEVVDLVTFKMNEHLRSESERAGGAHMSWFKMFNQYDVDGTGRIDFDEMHEVIRKELGISRAKLSEDEYRFLWEHLDQGDDGFIEARFARVLRAGRERETRARFARRERERESESAASRGLVLSRKRVVQAEPHLSPNPPLPSPFRPLSSHTSLLRQNRCRSLPSSCAARSAKRRPRSGAAGRRTNCSRRCAPR